MKPNIKDNKMNRLIIFVITLLSVPSLWAQDKPTGFASASGGTTGGQGGQTVTVSSLSALNNYAGSSTPYIILVNDTIESTNFEEVDINSNKTIVGVGSGATLKNIELHIIDKQNIIIRNLTIRDSYVEGDWDGKTNDNDAIQADNSHHIWIDHCHFSHCGDGLIDLRKACDYVTISWVHLSNHNKTFGIGWTDETDWRMTIHHCWFDNTNQRNPSFDQGMGHLYNNYLSTIASYGNLSRGNAQLVIQNSVFKSVNNPLSIWDNGKLYSSGNQFISCSGSKTGNVSDMPYNPESYYNYTLDPTSGVIAIVTSGAGPKAFISDQYTGYTTNYSLITTVGEGNGTVTPESNSYDTGQSVTLTATPDSGWLFDHWSGDLSGNTNPVDISMTGSKNISAYFVQNTTSVAQRYAIENTKLISYHFNPGHKTLYVRVNESPKLDVHIFSLSGKILMSRKFIQPKDLEISLNTLKNGIYIVKFELNRTVKTGRIILF